MFCVQKPKLYVNERFYSHFSKYTNVSICCWQTVNTCLTLWPNTVQCVRLPCPSLSPRVCSNSCPLSRWCHPTISFSVNLVSNRPQSFLASGSFPVSQLFASGGQIVGYNNECKHILFTLIGFIMNVFYWNVIYFEGLKSTFITIYSSIGNTLPVWLFKNKCQWNKYFVT